MNNEQAVEIQWRRFARLNERNQRDLRSFTNGINFQALREKRKKHSRKSRGLLVCRLVELPPFQGDKIENKLNFHENVVKLVLPSEKRRNEISIRPKC